MKTREAGRECAPVEPSSATSRNTSSPDMSPRPLARRSSPPDAPSMPRPRGEWPTCEDATGRSSLGGGALSVGCNHSVGKFSNFRPKSCPFAHTMRREPKKIVTRCAWHRANRGRRSERAAARSDAPLARVRVGLDDAGAVRVYLRVGGDTQLSRGNRPSLVRASAEATRLLVLKGRRRLLKQSEDGWHGSRRRLGHREALEREGAA